jgi:hypothetical protein
MSLPLLSACADSNAEAPVVFDPSEWTAEDAVPSFTSSGTISLKNNSGTTYQLTHISITSAAQGDADRFSWALPENMLMPLDILAGESLELDIVFSPLEEITHSASLTAQMWMLDYEVGGGGCSSGCGRDAPDTAETFVVALLTGTGNEEASFEDCGDGEDNDGDELIDCDDPDCLTFPGCIPGSEVCDDGEDNDGDGLIDCDDPDCVAHPECGGPSPEDCTDGIDNDGDGRVDCDDSDCDSHPDCAVVTGCEPTGLIECGGVVYESTVGAENNWASYCESNSGGWDGPEHVWAFFAEEDGEVEVIARRMGGGGPGGGGPGGFWDHDLTILRGELQGEEVSCDPTACVARAWNPPASEEEAASFEAEAGQLYFIVIDGWAGDAGDYELSVECRGGPEEEFDCNDGIDNDGDGAVDCDDSDCFGDPDCVGGGGDCFPAGPATCGGSEASSNNGPGSTDDVEDWCGEGLGLWTGPEITYLYFPEVSGEVTVRLGDLNADLDLTVLIADPTALPEDICNPEFCVDAEWRPGAQPETITFDAFLGSAYIFAIDGWDGAISDFTLEVSCAGGPATEQDCADGQDNDSDGATDCDDPDCWPDPVCLGVGPEICNDGLDNDQDGDTDCDDIIDCNSFPLCDYGDGDCCATNGSAGCENNLGEDCVCDADPYCCEGTWDALCVDLYVNACGGTCAGPPIETDCQNGIDDDGDGLVDCDDADCGTDPICLIPPTETECANNFDDDVDGLTDCADPDCFVDPVCQVLPFELDCANNIDDDLDGAIDCDDPDCSADPACQAPGVEDCSNGLDDDADGNVDCDDADCTFEPSCDAGDGDCCSPNGTAGCSDEIGEDCVCAIDPYCCNNLWDSICIDAYINACGGTCTGTEICNNGLDDDSDGLADCNDPDCAGDPSCLPPTTETSCTDGLDNDLDGLTDCTDPDCTGHPACLPPPTEGDCSNLIDDDGDGLIDCADPDCAADPLCNLPGTETNCADSIDNDGDGAIDCADVDCVADPNCNIFTIETNCFDGIDNDSDGDTDCDDSDCASLPSCNLPAESNCSNGIDDDADSFTDCTDPDCATDPACATGESDCSDNIDNDGDGDVDCDDADCSADLACVPTGDCNPIGNLGCGDVVTGSNDMAGSTDQQTEFCGNPLGPGWHGPEVAWLFSPQDSGLVDITLTGLSEDLDIMVLVQEPDGCDENDCEAAGWNPPPQPEQMDWYAFSGVPYYIVIDGWNGAISNFTMTITCTPSSESECADGLDNDADGTTDCADVDCLGDLACPETNCTDLVDNDADGFADCSDPDCFSAPTCLPELNCIDSLDNDLDGATDCDDSDCAAAAICQPESNCSDGLDNDADGSADCDDSDCAGAVVCLPESNCSDAVDNDIDGATDCDDSDCATDPACITPATETSCTNAIDDDGDGAIDCDDSDCAGNAACLSCSPSVATLSCGDVEFGNNAGGPSEFETYCGGTATDMTGPEQYYTVSSAVAQQITVTLSGLADDLDLFGLLSDPLGNCLAGNCLSYNPVVGTGNESVSFPLGAGGQTSVVVDGSQGATSFYLLSVSCSPTTSVEVCTDGLDNDGDGDEDCFDSDCAGDPSCDTETVCDDGFDNDADGLADCNDDDCLGTPGCPVVLFSSVDDAASDFLSFPLPGHASNSDWEQGTPDTAAQSGNGPASAYTGSLAWCTGCGNRVHAGGRFFSALVAQPLVFDLSPYPSGSLELSWYHWTVKPGGINIDWSTVEVSDDGGANTTTAWGPTLDSTNGWNFVTIDLSSYLGGDLTFSFVYDSAPFFFAGGASSADGWYVDDVELVWYP